MASVDYTGCYQTQAVLSHTIKLTMTTTRPTTSIGKAAERDAMLSAPLQTDVVTAPVTFTTLVLPASKHANISLPSYISAYTAIRHQTGAAQTLKCKMHWDQLLKPTCYTAWKESTRC